MSAPDHRALAPTQVACVIVTVSDTRTPATDTSGRAICDLLEAAGHVVLCRHLLRDEPADVARVIRDEVEGCQCQVIITTGGTGLSNRDSTYEALAGLFDKRVDGFGELFRMLSFQEIGAAAMLSRATAGVIGHCALFMLPGSEAAVRLAMTKLILPELGHIARELTR